MTPLTGTNRVTTRTLLLLFFGALVLIAGLFNLRDRFAQKPVPTDGVQWIDHPVDGVIADYVDPRGPAYAAGLRRGDSLLGICQGMCHPDTDQFEEVTEARFVGIYLDQSKEQVKNGSLLSYWIERKNYPIREAVAYLHELKDVPYHNQRGLYLALIGLVYLSIGTYILLRQGRAPYVTHFYVICLLAFVAHAYSATPELRTQFDKAIDFADVAALLFLAPTFIHLAAIYPARYHLFKKRRWLAAAIYVPAALLTLAEVWLRWASLRALLPGLSAINLRRGLDSFELMLFAFGLLLSCALFVRTFWQARTLTVRQQLKWIVWGVSIAAVAFAVFYVPAWLISPAEVSATLQAIALAPLILIPITLGYSIVRYRLMDVDVVVRRSAAYIIATLSVALLFGTLMAAIYEFINPLTESRAATSLIAALSMSALAMLFAPMKNWVQERIDRLFYGEKYDYRMTLQDFGRTLSSATELDPLLNSLVRRLKEVFSVDRLAVFIEDRAQASGFRTALLEGLDDHVQLPSDFLTLLRTRSAADGIARIESFAGGEADDPLDSLAFPTTHSSLSYYVPCAVRSRIVAVIGLGRTTDGALLSSEDIELLRAISGYVAVAIENALLLAEQGQRAKELARLKEFNENIIESINVGVMVINLAGRVTNWNGALETIYGLKRQQAIGHRITEVFQSDVLKALRELTARSEWHEGEPVNVYKFRARAADQRELTLNISLAPLQSKTSEIEGTLVAIEDVTERVRLEEQVQQSDKLSSIGLLAAGVAHEVNTPLAGISSYSQMLMQQIPDGDPRQLLLEKIHRQTSRASAIVNNLLNFSRVSDARHAPVNLNQVLDDTIQLLEAQLRNTQILVERNYDLDVPFAVGNAAKLQQVFMNLILNARDAMPQGGQLVIVTEALFDTVTVSFRDSGEGIAPEHLSKIYDPFFTTKQIGKGTGLGLAVSYGIVQDHGGHMDVQSKQGSGTCFQITLPLAAVPQQFAAASD